MPAPSTQSRGSSENYLHKITAEARKVKDCLVMTLGEPEFPPPAYIINSMMDCLQSDLSPMRVFSWLHASPLGKTLDGRKTYKVTSALSNMFQKYEKDLVDGGFHGETAGIVTHQVISILKSSLSSDFVKNFSESLEHHVEEQVLAMTRYAPVAGLPRLRVAFSNFLWRLGGVRYDPDTEIVVTGGGKEALAIAAYVVCDPGGSIFTPTPYWSGYNGMEMLSRASINAITIPYNGSLSSALEEAILNDAGRDTKRGKRAGEVDGLGHSKGSLRGCVLINSPNNPSGGIISNPERVLEISKKHDLMIISDDVYHSFVFDGKKNSFMYALPGAKEHVLVANSVSKSFSMTGFRVGCLAGPKEFISAATNAHANLLTCLPGFVQVAAARALESTPDELEGLSNRVSQYQRRRDMMHDGVVELYGPQVKPQGTFFYWLNISRFPFDAMEFSKRLLEEELVAVAPGNVFGDPSHVRLSLTIPSEDITLAVERLNKFAKKYGR